MFVRRVIKNLFALALLAGYAYAQQATTERAARLRAQLAELQAQQTNLQARLAQVDEDIKPENIERSLAGVGSMHPEELREARRRQLEIQRKGLQSQLDSLAAGRARLETAISIADSESYRQAIAPSTNSLSSTRRTTNKHSHRHRSKRRRSNR